MEPIVGKLCLAKTIKARHLTIFPEVLHKLAGGAAEQRCDVVIQRVHLYYMGQKMQQKYDSSYFKCVHFNQVSVSV